MALKGIYSALSGSMAQSQQLDTIANNISNVNTPAFKKEKQVFKEYLSANERQQDVIEVPRIPASLESFYATNGGERGYVDNVGTFTDHSAGGLRQTGGVLDLAIEGDGFFEVLTPQGPRLTRNGSFQLNADGILVNRQGFPVLRSAEAGTPPDERWIQFEDEGRINVSAFGKISQNGVEIADLSLMSVGNKNALQKTGESLYSLRENQDPQMTLDLSSKVAQGYLEQSNVNIVQEMTDMINTTRTFEATQKAIKSYDEMLQKLVNEVPKLS